MPVIEIVQAAVQHGLILSAALAAVIIGSLRLNAEMWLGDYPPDIQEKFGPISAEARRQRIPAALVFGAVLIGGLVLGVRWLLGALPTSPGFFAISLYVFVLVTTFNLFDLLVIDWLWFVRLRPGFVVLPGTEGMAGYKDYAFHFRAFLVGLAGSLVVSLIIAGVTALVTS